MSKSISARLDDRIYQAGIIGICAAIALADYVVFPAGGYGRGFPLDDAWIHQTYARNLAQYSEWAFLPGIPSAGSTAPLWSAALGVGYFLGLSPFLWTYFLGWLSLWASGVLGQRLAVKFDEGMDTKIPWAGLFVVFEWHLVWAAGSGMETLLAAVLILAVFNLLFAQPKAWLLIGLLVGGSPWVRPDGLTLLGPAIMILVLSELASGALPKRSMEFVSGFALGFVPYLVFNRWLAGAWWPNTFYAKQAEYAIELHASLLSRLAEQFSLPLVGAGILLLPGVLGQVYSAVVKKNWIALSAVFWVAGFLVVYALRLPVTYQHGRYAIPSMPVYFILGLAGSHKLMGGLSAGLIGRVFQKSWRLSIVIVLIAFFFMGLRAYGRDVAFIQSEMVATSHWVAENTPLESSLAAHDIGALGYFSGRNIIDLAGLVTPDVIPFIRDETRLAAFIDAQNADFLVTFPGWYPILSDMGRKVYSTQAPVAPELGGENMAVFCWRNCKVE